MRHKKRRNKIRGEADERQRKREDRRINIQKKRDRKKELLGRKETKENEKQRKRGNNNKQIE